MKPDTQAADVVTAEMVERASGEYAKAWREVAPHDDIYTICMRAALIASGLPAEVARLRELVDAANTPFEDADPRIEVYKSEHGWYGYRGETLGDTAPFKTWREAYRAAEGDLAYAELSRLRGELAAKQGQFDALRKAVFDECTMADKERIQSRYTVLVQTEKDQQP